MPMSSRSPGTSTFHSEVTEIGRQGFWLVVDDREYFVPFSDYPVFRSASVEQIFAMEQIGPTQLHWESLDADIELDALERPELYPLTWR